MSSKRIIDRGSEVLNNADKRELRTHFRSTHRYPHKKSCLWEVQRRFQGWNPTKTADILEISRDWNPHSGSCLCLVSVVKCTDNWPIRRQARRLWFPDRAVRNKEPISQWHKQSPINSGSWHVKWNIYRTEPRENSNIIGFNQRLNLEIIASWKAPKHSG